CHLRQRVFEDELLRLATGKRCEHRARAEAAARKVRIAAAVVIDLAAGDAERVAEHVDHRAGIGGAEHEAAEQELQHEHVARDERGGCTSSSFACLLHSKTWSSCARCGRWVTW